MSTNSGLPVLSLVKRAPVGFMGMRGKKDFELMEDTLPYGPLSSLTSNHESGNNGEEVRYANIVYIYNKWNETVSLSSSNRTTRNFWTGLRSSFTTIIPGQRIPRKRTI